MLRNDAQYSGKTEGWSTSISPNLSASENGFDGAYTSWSSVGGVFDPQTKEHPFRYQVRLPETLKVQKCEVGQFEVEGNIYEIVSIADHPKSKRMKGTMDGGGSGPVNRRPYSIPPEPKTDIMLRVVSIKNPYSSIRISLGDSNGKEIFYVDKHDKPIAYEEVSRWNNRNGVYEPGTKIVDPPYHYVGGGQFDPRSMEARKYPIAVSVLMSKGNCKNLLIYTAQHKVYVFEHIKLDVN